LHLFDLINFRMGFFSIILNYVQSTNVSTQGHAINQEQTILLRTKFITKGIPFTILTCTVETTQFFCFDTRKCT